MYTEIMFRISALCVVLAAAETLHGIVRTTLIVPLIGKERAIKLSALTGTLLALLICWWLVPALNLHSAGAHLLLGVVLAVFMASFDIALGKWLLRKSWAKIRLDFSPRSGNYLIFGLSALCFIPLAVWYAKRG